MFFKTSGKINVLDKWFYNRIPIGTVTDFKYLDLYSEAQVNSIKGWII